MKKENCPFCGHRWIRKSGDYEVECPSCNKKYDPKDFEEGD